MPRRRIYIALLLMATLFSSRRSGAQEKSHAAKTEFYAGYGFLSNSFNDYAGFSGSPMNGWDASVTRHVASSLSLTFDALGLYGTSLFASQSEHSLLAGPQWTWHLARESAFVHGLVGIGHINKGAIPFDNSSPSSNGFTFAALAGGGIDTTLSHNLAWRIEGDYLRSQYGSNSDQIHNLRGNFAHFTTGLVFRF